MRDLRDPDRTDAIEPAGPADSASGARERPDLRDAYVDDEWDIFPDTDADADADSDTDTGTGSDTGADADSDTGTDSDSDPDTGTGADTDMGADMGADTGTGADADSDTGAGTDADPGAPDTPDLSDGLDEALARLEADHPPVGSVVRRLAADTDHRLDLTRDLTDPRNRDTTLAVIRELAEGRLLPDSDLEGYRRECPGQGPLFAEVPEEVNRNADGTSTKDGYLGRCALADPARRIGVLPDARQREVVDGYANRLANDVEPVVTTEVEDLAADIPGAAVSVRTKNADDILEKVRRMSSGSDSRPPREDYRVGDVVDAVGARITVADTDQLAELLGRVRDTFGTGEGGRILELDNMYAAPKASNPSYRVIPLLVAVEAEGVPYTYELQLTTRRASVAADLEHNTIYKPYAEPSDPERSAVRQMMAEAAALDQEETRQRHRTGHPADGTRRT